MLLFENFFFAVNFCKLTRRLQYKIVFVKFAWLGNNQTVFNLLNISNFK